MVEVTNLVRSRREDLPPRHPSPGSGRPAAQDKGAFARGAAKRRMRESCSEEGTVIAAPSPNVRGFSCRRISPTVHDHCFHQIARMCEPKTTRTVGSHFAGGADRSTYSLKGG
jgi:hypothetical protein